MQSSLFFFAASLHLQRIAPRVLANAEGASRQRGAANARLTQQRCRLWLPPHVIATGLPHTRRTGARNERFACGRKDTAITPPRRTETRTAAARPSAPLAHCVAKTIRYK
eukprot:gnl/Chilomastix_cuspidata/6783.p6 GENE.gnl/Chilomastix_cuspidata/6783~~gnl/Chilomastix_cuspidata/6783.p6  ORF type:complete len:110 (-),score=8.70 gnl/Chilomastix_cuspidata/6783:38-367(-)